MSVRQRILGVAIGLIAGVVAVYAFVELGSGDTIDGAALSGSETITETVQEPAADEPAGEDEPSGGDSASDAAASEPTVQTITISGGEPEGGIVDIDVNKGDDVRFRVESDTADEVHVHGVDITKDVEAGGSVSFDFTADIEGIFEVELEGSQTQIAKLTVNP